MTLNSTKCLDPTEISLNKCVLELEGKCDMRQYWCFAYVFFFVQSLTLVQPVFFFLQEQNHPSQLPLAASSPLSFLPT